MKLDDVRPRHIKAMILKSLKTEVWEPSTLCQCIEDFPDWRDGAHEMCLKHPTRPFMVSQSGEIYLHSASIHKIVGGCCIRRAAQGQIVRHAYCDLTGETENNR